MGTFEIKVKIEIIQYVRIRKLYKLIILHNKQCLNTKQYTRTLIS